MKRIFLFLSLFLVLLVSSCSKIEEFSSDSIFYKEISFETYFSAGDNSKTCISPKDDSKILWSPQEKITVFYPDNDIYKSSCFISTNTESSSVVSFTGKIERDAFVSPIEGSVLNPWEYYAVYPYDENNRIDGTDLLFDIKKKQTAADGTFSVNTFPAVAHTIDNRLCFWNVCGGLSFSVVNENIRSVILSSTDNSFVSGRVRVVFDQNGHPAIKEFIDGSSSVILNAPDSKTFTPGVLYYIALAPAVLEKGFNLRFLTESTKADTLINKRIEIKRSTFGKLSEIDKGLSFPVKVQSVELDASSLTLRQLSNHTLNVSVKPSDASDKSVTWSSTNPEIASVSESGVVSALSVGSCKIVVTSNEDPEIADTCEVSVISAIDEIKIQGKKDIDLGESAQFNATIYPDDTPHKNVTWSCSNTKVATVNDNGVVSSVSEGTAIIRVTSVVCPDKFDEIEITVTRVSKLDDGSTFANCYIVSSAGVYDFAPVRGVSGSALSGVSSVAVLWEHIEPKTKLSPGTVIKKVELKNGRVRITTPSTLVNGDAVVAVKNSAGKILWSWHIWVLDGYDIEDNKILCRNGQYLMDRNLGAADSGVPSPRGLLYQWGRKDPFPTTSAPNVFTSVSSWPNPVASSASTGTIDYTIENPMCFITGNSSGDWYSGESSMKKTRWTDNGKTDYDPCPYGWKVPSGGDKGFWETAIDRKAEYKWDYTNEGLDMSKLLGLSNLCWFQGTGFFSASHTIQSVSGIIDYWTSSFSSSEGSNYAMCFLLMHGGSIMNLGSDCAEGAAIRCVKE